MNHLVNEYEKNQETEDLALEFMQITDLAPLMHQLEKFKQLKSLSLHGNRLKSLPTDLSRLRELEQIDLTNNMFTNLDDVLTNLQYLPRLQRLHYNLRNEQEKDQALRMLPGLTQLNGQGLSRKNNGSNYFRATKQIPTITQKEIEDVAVLYDRIRQLYRQNGLGVDQQLAEQFDDTVETIIKDLGRKLREDNSGEGEYIAKARVLCSKYALIDMCFTKFIGLLGIVDQMFEGIVETIHNAHAHIFKELAETILYKQFATEEKEQAQHVKHRLRMYQSEMERLRKQRDACEEEIAELTLQNERLIAHMVKYGKNVPPSPRPAFDKSSKTPERERLAKSPKSRKQNEPNLQGQLPQAKKLNLRQLKDLIQELFAAKSIYDRKCEDNQRPYETLQQYMYTFFNKKYGLKALALEWAMGVVTAIKKYGGQDVEVMLFGKALRNEVEEQYRNEFMQIKEQIDDCFKTQIKRKTQKNTHEVDVLFAEKQQSTIALYDVEEVVRYFFSKQDAEILLQQISSKAGSDSSTVLTPSKQKGAHIRYSVLIQMLMQHNLRQHEQLLMPFVKQFHRVDQDSDGIVTQAQFRTLYLAMSDQQQRSAYNEVLGALDPTGSRRITFSRACSLLQDSPSPNPLISMKK